MAPAAPPRPSPTLSPWSATSASAQRPLSGEAPDRQSAPAIWSRSGRAVGRWSTWSAPTRRCGWTRTRSAGSTPPPEPGCGLVDLLRGGLYFLSEVRRTLTVRTPYVNAGVEGTEVYLRVADAGTEMIVLEGRVAATPGNASGGAIRAGRGGDGPAAGGGARAGCHR